MRVTAAAVAFGLLACCSASVHAQGFPNRPVRFIVPFPPGGGTDAFARVVGAKLAEDWGQQVLVDNRPGAQGNIGTAAGARAAPDGHTITLAYVGTLAINPHLYKQPGYDALNDFAAITRGTEEAWILVVHPSVPARSAKELAALAKGRANRLSFASSASGTQMVGELFKAVTGTQILHVPYKGAGPAVIDLLAGNVDMMFSNPTSAVPHARSGRLRALVVTGKKRLEALPDIPVAAEAGYPELDVIGWYGVIAPAATSRELVVRLNADLVRVLNLPEVRDRMRAIGQALSPSTSEEFATQIRSDFERWGRVVRQSGARVE
jgi:tripartite-type tricarboxylate transporter receptor subunit TctC